MASVEVISLLCAGSTQYHGLRGGSWCGDNLSRSELAGLLSGLSSHAMNLALAKYAMDIDAERLLIAHVRNYAEGLAVNEHWHIVKGRPVLCNMAALAVFETVRPNRCVKCSGRSVVNNKVCNVCHGTGYKHFSGRQVADGIGVDEKCYRKLWKSRFEWLCRYVTDINVDVIWRLRDADREKIRMVC